VRSGNNSIEVANNLYELQYRLFIALLLLSSALLIIGISLLAMVYTSIRVDREVTNVKISASLRYNALREHVDTMVEVLANKYGIDYDQLIADAKQLKDQKNPDKKDCKV
jgi:hypothetical protein